MNNSTCHRSRITNGEKANKENLMNLVPWRSRSMSPTNRPLTGLGDELTTFQKEMNALMSSFFNQRDLSIPQSFSTNWYPSIDLKEQDNKYLIDADVPGINEADLDIDFHDNTLTIRGETKSDVETNDQGYVCVERSRGTFRRDIYLDEEVDKDSIKADLKNGVLHIEMIKKEKSRTAHKKIPIKH
jgi:HSP20 family protein